MLVDAAKQGDVEIPVFCYEPKLGDPVGACRMCLVEIEGMPKLQTACSTPVRDGMVVYTQTDRVRRRRTRSSSSCSSTTRSTARSATRAASARCRTSRWAGARARAASPIRSATSRSRSSSRRWSAIDRERCILCYRCVRFSQEVAEDEQLQLLERGDKTFVGTFDERPYIAPFHGNIIELCPVGALTSYTYRFRARPWDIEQAGSVCTLCPSQCNVSFTVRDERVAAGARPRQRRGRRRLALRQGPLRLPDVQLAERITRPMVRAGDGSLSPIGWDDAVARAADGLRSAGEKAAASSAAAPPTRRAGSSSGSSEGAGSSNVDSLAEPGGRGLLGELSGPSRLRMADLDNADAILVVGIDPLHEMPILDLRIRKAVRRSRAKLVVASERPTALDGGAARRSATRPGERHRSFAPWPERSAPTATTPTGPFEEEAAAIAEDAAKRTRPGRSSGASASGASPARSTRCTPACTRCEMHQRIGPGLLEVPEESNGRGLREVGCLPGREARAGARDGRTRQRGDQGGPHRPRARRRCCSSTRTRSGPTRTPTGGAKALAGSFVVAIACFEDESTRLADIVIPAETFAEKEGTVTHPEGRLQRCAETCRCPRA